MRRFSIPQGFRFDIICMTYHDYLRYRDEVMKRDGVLNLNDSGEVIVNETHQNVGTWQFKSEVNKSEVKPNKKLTSTERVRHNIVNTTQQSNKSVSLDIPQLNDPGTVYYLQDQFIMSLYSCLFTVNVSNITIFNTININNSIKIILLSSDSISPIYEIQYDIDTERLSTGHNIIYYNPNIIESNIHSLHTVDKIDKKNNTITDVAISLIRTNNDERVITVYLNNSIMVKCPPHVTSDRETVTSWFGSYFLGEHINPYQLIHQSPMLFFIVVYSEVIIKPTMNHIITVTMNDSDLNVALMNENVNTTEIKILNPLDVLLFYDSDMITSTQSNEHSEGSQLRYRVSKTHPRSGSKQLHGHRCYGLINVTETLSIFVIFTFKRINDSSFRPTFTKHRNKVTSISTPSITSPFTEKRLCVDDVLKVFTSSVYISYYMCVKV